ncbi:MAG: hypothetical protein L0G99_16480, partial [Propionibacteriales bacterium]|nr:hypothetical protein [Propionibacteriales bacterium]
MTAAHVAPSVTSRRTADLLLDAHRLSGLVGHPVRATRLRHKPNLSTVAALVSSDGDPLAGVPCWVQVAEPGHHGKIDKAVRRAADRGLVLHRIPVPDSELMLAHGTADTDPRLSTGLQDLSAGSRPIETSV